MKLFIITIKMLALQAHDPKNKKLGYCRAKTALCSDSTGEHHSFLVRGESVEQIINTYKQNYDVTRVEEIDLIPYEWEEIVSFTSAEKDAKDLLNSLAPAT